MNLKKKSLYDSWWPRCLIDYRSPERGGDTQDLTRFSNGPRRNGVRSVLVFLDLLESEAAERIGEFDLAHARRDPVTAEVARHRDIVSLRVIFAAGSHLHRLASKPRITACAYTLYVMRMSLTPATDSQLTSRRAKLRQVIFQNFSVNPLDPGNQLVVVET